MNGITGRVKSIKSTYAFLTSDEGLDYFADQSEFPHKRMLPVDTRVTFDHWFNEKKKETPTKGRQAVRIQPLTSAHSPKAHDKRPEQPAVPVASIPAPIRDFLHPYYFGFVDRNALKGHGASSGPQDAQPQGHHRLHETRWSGRLQVTLTAVTPLLLLDAAERVERADGHKTFRTRVHANGKPMIPETSFKGMLRQAFELITASRFGVFPMDSHHARLGFRERPRRDQQSYGARIETRDGALRVRVFQAKASIRAYPGCTIKTVASKDHGQLRYARIDNGQVREIHKKPADGLVPGYVHWTGRSFSKKQNELFFYDPSLETHELTPALQQQWRDLIRSFVDAHRPKDLDAKPTHNAAEWSRHLKGDPEAQRLREGVLCFARLDANGAIESLVPVQVGRQLFKASPAQLARKSVLEPATKLEQLSAADRAFGFVSQAAEAGANNNAYRGHVRIERIVPNADANVDKVDPPGLPLEILSAPKPTQARFYTVDSAGKSLHGKPNAALYQDDHRLAGHKLYPHQSRPPEAWSLEKPDASAEFLRTDAERDDQNRSILSWVRPGSSFDVEIRVQNLAAFELGALLWLLTLEEGHYHRLGGAKPLGFGSVRVELNYAGSSLESGIEARKRYLHFPSNQPSPLSFKCVDQIKSEFVSGMRAAFGMGAIDELPFVRAFLKACRGIGGGGHRTHYPRRNPERPAPIYEWFVANSRDNADPRERGAKLALPALGETADLTLPYKPTVAP